MAEPVRLTAALRLYPHTRALKRGLVRNDAVALDFVEVDPIHDAFAPMIRHQAYDVSELAIVVALQAVAAGKKLILLPAVVAGRMQRGCLICHRSRGPIAGAAIAGKRVGVRAYSQTTGMWVRAALREDYGLAVTDMRWFTQGGSHLAEFADPDFVQPATPGKSLPAMLRDGDIDAAILGNDLPEGEEFAPVIPDHAARDAAWVAAHGFLPINHLVAASAPVAAAHPAAVAAVYHLLRQSAAQAEQPAGRPGPTLFGIEALRAPLRDIIAECYRQGLIPRLLDPDAVLAPAAALLDAQHVRN